MRYHLVSLSRAPQTTPDSDGFFESLTPATWWAKLQPEGAISSDGTRVQGYRVTGRYHAGITVDTRIVWTDGTTEHELFVKGVTDVGAEHREMVLYCEEIIP